MRSVSLDSGHLGAREDVCEFAERLEGGQRDAPRPDRCVFLDQCAGHVFLQASGFHLRNREWLASLETALWASLAASIAIARWGELSTGPSITRDALIPIWIVLLPGIIINLILLTRATAPDKLEERPRATNAAS
ncbi:hypothetical protein ACXC9Q_23220 (plasmid) [Kribbella sp. CWNU-51]